MARIDLTNITKRWDAVTAVDGIDLSLADGEFAAILGPSGCGKSTTLFMLAGIYEPTEGDILFDGARVNAVEARDRNVGIVFQSYALYPNMTVLQNIQFPLRFKNLARAEAEKQAREIADLVQIGPLLDRRPGQLSGGQQQRVALARALVKRPNLLLLDEPLSNLDATLRLSMRAEIRRIQRELGVTTILVTHDQIEAMTMADRIICMNAGRIEQAGTPDTLYRRPASTFVAGFVGSPPINLVPAGTPGLHAPEGASHIGMRPEHIFAADLGMPGEIRMAEAMGREVLYLAKTEMGDLRFLEAGATARFAAGDKVVLACRSEDTIAFDAEGQLMEGAHGSL